MAGQLGLGDYTIAWQSAGRTDDPWWGPPDRGRDPSQLGGERSQRRRRLQRRLRRRPSRDPLRPRHRGDPDRARMPAIAFARTRMPNADPAYLDVLAQVVRDHLAQARGTRSREPADAARRGRRRRGERSRHRVPAHAGRARARRGGAGGRRPDRREAAQRRRRRPGAAGGRRLVPRAQAVGRGAVQGAGASPPSSMRQGPSGSYLWTDEGSSSFAEGRAVRHPRRRGRRLPLAGTLEGRSPPRGAGPGARQAEGARATRRSARCCGAGWVTRPPTWRWRPLLAGLFAGDVDRLSVQATFPELARVGAEPGEPDPRVAGRLAQRAAWRRARARCSCDRAAAWSVSPTSSRSGW